MKFIALSILLFNATLIATFTHAAATKTPDPQPWGLFAEIQRSFN